MPQANEDSGDQGLTLMRADGAVTCEQAEDHWSIDKVEDQLTIDVLANFSANDSALPHHAGGGSADMQEALAKQREKPWIVLPFREKLAEEATERTGIERHD